MDIPTSYSVPVAVPLIPVSALTQSPIEGEITQMFDNMTFSRPPISPQMTNSQSPRILLESAPLTDYIKGCMYV